MTRRRDIDPAFVRRFEYALALAGVGHVDDESTERVHHRDAWSPYPDASPGAPVPPGGS